MRSFSHHLPDDRISLITNSFMERAVLPLMRSGEITERQLAVAVAVKTDPRQDFEVVLLRGYNIDEGDCEQIYLDIAVRKCSLAFRTERSTREVVLLSPHLLLDNSVVHPGGVFHQGIVVAISGLSSINDEAFSLQLAAELWRYGMYHHKLALEQRIDFLPRIVTQVLEDLLP